uniref:Uncharacterized protein n=1 Tax=Aegilops tauschii subsp. strangulata TaxID=200361 RepID=A0A452YN21_AEGTS
GGSRRTPGSDGSGCGMLARAQPGRKNGSEAGGWEVGPGIGSSPRTVAPRADAPHDAPAAAQGSWVGGS